MVNTANGSSSPATFNPNAAEMLLAVPSPTQIVLIRPSYGISPAGFPRLHVELIPREVGRMVGYDPRVLVRPKAKPPKLDEDGIIIPARIRKDVAPHNVSNHIVELQNKVQRSIDPARVAQMVVYLHNAMSGDAFADWGAIEVVTSAKPDLTRLDVDHTIKMDANADYFIADGQHRYCALLDFVREYPEYSARFTQSVTISILPGQKLDEWAGQAFHDRNYYAQAVRAGKALSVDARDPVNALAKKLADHPMVKHAGGVAYERDTLLQGDFRFTTHSVLHRFVKGFLFGRGGLDKNAKLEGEIDSQEQINLGEYISALGEILPWPQTFPERDKYLTRTSVVFAALAVVGHDLYNSSIPKEEMFLRLQTLGKLDWRRSNLAWVGILGVEKDGKVQPASSRPAIDGTIRFLRERLGLLNLLKKDETESE